MNEYNERLQHIGCYIYRNIAKYKHECFGQVIGHHEIGNQTIKGMAKKASDERVASICVNHHTGRYGIHQIGVKTWEAKYTSQDNMIKWTKQQLEDI